MPRQGIAYDWKLLASVLANSDSEEQTQFFKAFVKEMDSWGTVFQQQTQLCWTNEKLTEHEKDVLGMLGYREVK